MAVYNWLPKPIDGKETGKMEEALKAVDIRDTLNAYNGKVSNKTTSFFKPEANINKWSKHKPIVSPKLFLPFDDEKWGEQDGSTPNAILGDNNNTAGLESVFNTTSTEDDWFNYTLPTGGTSQPLRKGDFRGYRADAFSPFQSFTVNESTANQAVGTGDVTQFQIYVRCFLNNEFDEKVGGMMTLTDLGIFNSTWNSHRLAVIERVKKGNGYVYSLHTGDTLETGWGYGVVNRKAWTVNDLGEHEFKAVIHTDNGYNYALPFPVRKVTVYTVYTGNVIINMSGSIGYTSDGLTGNLTAYFDYVRADTTSTEDTVFTVPISFSNEDGTYQEQLEVVTFTVPNTNLTPVGQPIYEYSGIVANPSSPYWSEIVRLHKEDNLYLYFGSGERVKVN